VNQENSATEQPLAGKETPFLRHLNMKNASFLPRQARDKHRENLKKSGVSLGIPIEMTIWSVVLQKAGCESLTAACHSAFLLSRQPVMQLAVQPASLSTASGRSTHYWIDRLKLHPIGQLSTPCNAMMDRAPSPSATPPFSTD
jgi:hypothetical protein